jgi:hypothetical protein
MRSCAAKQEIEKVRLQRAGEVVQRADETFQQAEETEKQSGMRESEQEKQ